MAHPSQLLKPIASQFQSMGIPEPSVPWGYSLMMAIVFVVMGSFGRTALCLLFLYAVLGLKLGLTI